MSVALRLSDRAIENLGVKLKGSEAEESEDALSCFLRLVFSLFKIAIIYMQQVHVVYVIRPFSDGRGSSRMSHWRRLVGTLNHPDRMSQLPVMEAAILIRNCVCSLLALTASTLLQHKFILSHQLGVNGVPGRFASCKTRDSHFIFFS